MPELIPLLGKKEIEKRVIEIADAISSDYENDEPVFIGVLKGAFIFLSDLIRRLSISAKVDFLGVSSYGDATAPSERMRLTKDIGIDVKGRHVILVEDIVDTGRTLNHIIDHIRSFGPETVKICALIDKRERRETNVSIDYACHVVDKGFLVGYGLDFAEKYRNLPEIYRLT